MVGYETIGAPIPHPSKPRDWWILAQCTGSCKVVKAHKAASPWTIEEYEHYLRSSPILCHMRKYHTMATRSKVPRIEDWKTLPFGKRCSICKAFLCEGKKNKRNCALYE